MLPSPDIDGLQRLLWHFAAHRVLTSAASTGILRFLAERPATPNEVSQALRLASQPCAKTMRALTALGLLEREGEHFQVVEPLARFFCAGPDDLAPFLAHSQRMYEGWGEHLEDWIRGLEWPHGPRTPEQDLKFSAAMRAMGRQTALSVLPLFDLSGARTMLDVGGGHGHWSEVFCESYPALEATVFDTPETIASAERAIAGSPRADRIRFAGGDYLRPPIGSGNDIVLLANVLHQESAENAPLLINNCVSALAPGGRFALVDFRIDDDRCGPALGALFAINMRDFGDTWTEPEIRGWMEAAGLKDIHRQDVGLDRWLFTGCAGNGEQSAVSFQPIAD